MAVNYPYYPGQQPQSPQTYMRPTYMEQTQPRIGIKGHPVTSVEEARAASIDFDGSVFYFPDIANKRIYTKQINLDGTSSFNVYEWKNDPVINSPQYVTREEFDATLQQLKEVLQERNKKEEIITQPQIEKQNFNF